MANGRAYLNPANLLLALSQQQGQAAEPVSRRRVVSAANQGSDGTVQNAFNLDSGVSPSMPEGRLYVPEDVRCGITVHFADNDPAQVVPGDPSSTYQPPTRWHEVHCLRGPDAQPEIVRDPQTYIFGPPRMRRAARCTPSWPMPRTARETGRWSGFP